MPQHLAIYELHYGRRGLNSTQTFYKIEHNPCVVKEHIALVPPNTSPLQYALSFHNPFSPRKTGINTY